jgi:hypothetical protein
MEAARLASRPHIIGAIEALSPIAQSSLAEHRA